MSVRFANPYGVFRFAENSSRPLLDWREASIDLNVVGDERVLAQPKLATCRSATRAHIAQAVEHFLGKEEVIGSNPIVSTISVKRGGRVDGQDRADRQTRH